MGIAFLQFLQVLSHPINILQKVPITDTSSLYAAQMQNYEPTVFGQHPSCARSLYTKNGVIYYLTTLTPCHSN